MYTRGRSRRGAVEPAVSEPEEIAGAANSAAAGRHALPAAAEDVFAPLEPHQHYPLLQEWRRNKPNRPDPSHLGRNIAPMPAHSGPHTCMRDCRRTEEAQ